MPRKSEKSEILKALPIVCSGESAAVEFFEAQRWPEGAACPRCGDTAVRKMLDKDGNRNARYLWRCGGCKKQFTVRVGTIMEDSPIPLRHWAFAFWAACASKKGVSALQISRLTGLSYKSALFLMHRIRWAMVETGGAPLTCTIEVDETYVGGKPRKGDGKLHKRGRGTSKTPVVAMVQRGGKVRTRVVASVTADNLASAMRECVHPSSRIVTDELPLYKRATKGYAAHDSVCHSTGEYAREDVHTNTAEGYFSLLKRAIFGTYHHVSKEHLHRYVAEREFVYNNRHIDDGERVALAIREADGKRLFYRDSPLRAAIA